MFVYMWCTGLLMLVIASGSVNGVQYFGKPIGSFKNYHHGAVGDVYAVDSRTIHIRGFSYDGQGPDAFFWAGSSDKPDGSGFIVLNEKGTKDVLQSYRNKDITITLPEGKTLNDIKWLSVWCRSFSANFADVFIPTNFEYPKPRRLEKIVGVMHNASSGPIVAVDAQTFMIPNFYLDGQAPDAHFWVGTGAKPSVDGILVPDENGSPKPLGRYDGQSLVISLPGELTVFDIDWLSVWCREFSVDFGHVKIPKNLNVPPSLKMLGVSPQSKLNCEVLSEENGFEVRWAKAGDTVVIQLVAILDSGKYMSFGLSGDDKRSQMVGGDVAVGWIDNNGGHVLDYFLDSKAQCSNGRGSCPDYKLLPNTNSVRLLNAAKVNGYTMITYQRPLIALDELDKAILDNGPQPIIWAIGPLNDFNEASYHDSKNSDNVFIDFNRVSSWNCPPPATESHSPAATTPHSIKREPAIEETVNPPPKPVVPSTPAVESVPKKDERISPVPSDVEPWFIPPVECPEPLDNVFYAQIGPAGGKKGYTSITGHVGWGIAWYINGLLIPEITVVRGKTYTFVVEGGDDPEAPARNHPLYITDDPVGGYVAKSPEEREKVRVFAGVQINDNGEPEPTAVGRLCEWVQKSKDPAEKYNSFGEYQRVLELRCEKGQAGVLQWTPDADTPDLVFYQCFTHRHLGWRIHVVDQCEFDPEFGSSILHETNVEPVREQRVGDNARSLPNDKVPENEDSPLPNLESKSDLNGSNSGVGFAGTLQIVGGFHPVTAAPLSFGPTVRSAPHPPPSLPGMSNTTFISDPFISNKSIPFQAGFQPGEPQFGGFGASNFGQRFEKAPPVYFSKRVVPITSIVPNLPSRLGNVYQAGKPSNIRVIPPNHGEAMSAQHPVVFRAPAPQDGVPPPPPKLPVPQRPPNGNLIRRVVRPVSGPHRHHLISADGTPVGDGQSVIAPPSLTVDRPNHRPVPHAGRGDGPFMGTTPPPIPSEVPKLPQFMPQNRGPQKPQPVPQQAPSGQGKSDSNRPISSSDTESGPTNSSFQNDFAILSNVMSIINREKESEQIRQSQAQRRPQRRGRRYAEKEEPAAEPSAEPEPVASSEATSQDKDNMLHEHKHDMNKMDSDSSMKKQEKDTKQSAAQNTEAEKSGVSCINHTGFIILMIFSILSYVHCVL